MSVIITVFKSIAKKRIVKTEGFYVRRVYSDIWSV
jgi:hypothetical protein